MLDALELAFMNEPLLILEFGSGSGIVSAFLSKMYTKSLILGCDVNIDACNCTRRVASVDTIHVDVLKLKLRSKIDLIVCNPPYVPTEDSKLLNTTNRLEWSWAGGENGMQFTEILLNRASSLLSDHGSLIFLLIAQNNPVKIVRDAHLYNLTGSIILERKAGIERIFVCKFSKIFRTN